MGFERVHTVWDFYDRPRTGLADYNGRPHYYSSDWDDKLCDYTETYALSPVDDETLRIALEQWEIWCKWAVAFHAGSVPPESHPKFGGKDPKYDELDALLKAKLSNASPLPHRVRANFRDAADSGNTPRGGLRPLEVEWLDIRT